MANRPEELIVSTNNDLISHDLQTNNVVGNVYEMTWSNFHENQVLLSTANILIEDISGKLYECTALLDSGSQCNLMSESLSKKLK